MKRTLLMLAVAGAIFFTSCKKSSDSPGNGGGDTPRSEVPDEMVGKWLNGNFSMTDWYDYTGSWTGNAYERSTAFDLKKNGDASFFLIVQTYDGYCRTQGMTDLQGTVKFDEANHSFTLYPQQGRYRGFYSCQSDRNFDRAAGADELKAATYYYSFETIGGVKYMVIRFSPGDSEEGSYFKASSW